MDRVGKNGGVLSRFPHAEAFDPGDLEIVDDGYACAGCMKLAHALVECARSFLSRANRPVGPQVCKDAINPQAIFWTHQWLPVTNSRAHKRECSYQAKVVVVACCPGGVDRLSRDLRCDIRNTPHHGIPDAGIV